MRSKLLKDICPMPALGRFQPIAIIICVSDYSMNQSWLTFRRAPASGRFMSFIPMSFPGQLQPLNELLAAFLSRLLPLEETGAGCKVIKEPVSIVGQGGRRCEQRKHSNPPWCDHRSAHRSDPLMLIGPLRRILSCH